MKLTVSVFLVAKGNVIGPDVSPTSSGPRSSRWDILTTGHRDAAVPAFLYTFATFLQSVGAQNLDIVPYLILSQAKVTITPVFGTLFLKQRFTRRHWVCFIMIAVGVIIVQMSPTNAQNTRSTASTAPQARMLGVAAMLLSGVCVAFAGVRVESMLRTGKQTFMSRNAQLAWYSWFSAGSVYIWRSKTGSGDFFGGYNLLVWVFTLLQAAGGFIVAWCVALTSTVTKNHAQVVGFLLASTISLVLQGNINIQHLCGVILSVGALFEYAYHEPPTATVRRKHFAAEKCETVV
ncbi:nucleotide-sugar transporter-domain-containing protein [Aspergillus tamarii]|uniref:Nucleotide-sugar transporter-domain-containing protein n=1 Tax=Aspergillus tamarii TaxID=41984 RepID=A0A5N6UAH3_ASPTM|nr:nucleotide-sugar transporter-domain-containing protein [Aspergillus tamarii]